jgi:DNA-directed RNA polymerase specialized sigma24 family protein
MDRSTAFELLPETYAAALLLRDAGSPPAEIAASLGIAPEGLRAALELAEAKLARLLADDGRLRTRTREDPYPITDDGAP